MYQGAYKELGDVVGSVVADGTRYDLTIIADEETWRVGISDGSVSNSIFIEFTSDSGTRYILSNMRELNITAFDLTDFS